MDERTAAGGGLPQGTTGRAVKPDRGAMILTFGIIGLVVTCLFFLGTIAWVLAYNDLREMKNGTRDAAGAALTKAGMICGIVGTAIAGLAILWFLFVLLLIGTGIMGGLCAL
jgi:hypothetical protein